MKTKQSVEMPFGLHFVISANLMDEKLWFYAAFFQESPYLCNQNLAR
jgi:hypothetical protein